MQQAQEQQVSNRLAQEQVSLLEQVLVAAWLLLAQLEQLTALVVQTK
jgi:hypothetical protein